MDSHHDPGLLLSLMSQRQFLYLVHGFIMHSGYVFFSLLHLGVVGWGKGAVCHRSAHLRLAYGWARPAILVAAGTGRGENVYYFFCFFTFIHFPLSLPPPPPPPPYPSLSFPLLSLLSLFTLSLGDETKWPTRVDVSLNPNTINKIVSPPKHILWATNWLFLVTHRSLCWFIWWEKISERVGSVWSSYRTYTQNSNRQAWANSVDPDQTPQNAASDQGLHFLWSSNFRHIYCK